MRFTTLLLALVALCSACEKDAADDGPSETPLVVPATYDFERVSYAGQQERLAMLLEIRGELASANAGETVNGDQLRAMYANAEGANFSRAYERDLRSKTFAGVRDSFDRYIDRLAALSALPAATVAAESRAGYLPNASGSRTYLFDDRGVEYAQIIEKGLMGALLYYQATTVYMGADKMSADNTDVDPAEGTAMEHHWDEAFGYLGVARGFPEVAEGAVYWGRYAQRREPALGSGTALMDALIKGRAAISAKRLDVRDEAIAEARAAWELISVGSALHYLNAAYENPDLGSRLHELSEAVAFAYALQFNEATRFDRSAYRSWLQDLAGGETFANINLYEATDAKIDAARQALATRYGLNDKLNAL